MSQWTHVNAAIRFDRVPGVRLSLFSPDLKADVPTGSEGPLRHRSVTYGDELSAAWLAVHIWGDLRDYADVEEIRKYLERVTAGKIVRDGVATINVENGRQVVLRYEPREDAWITVMDVDRGEEATDGETSPD